MCYPHAGQQLTPRSTIARLIPQFYVALPAIRRWMRPPPPTTTAITVQLLPCNKPQGALETAPRTSLRNDTAHERWEGFWCLADERYYTRCVRTDGSQQWFRIVDQMVRVRADREVRVFTFRPRRTRDARSLIVGTTGGRSILVGTSRRAPRGRASADA